VVCDEVGGWRRLVLGIIVSIGYSFGLPWWLSSKESTCYCWRSGLDQEDSLRRNGSPLQYSCLGNPINREACGLRCMESQRVGYDLVTAAAKSLQSCPTLCDPIDGRPSGSPVPGILQARTLEWLDISFSKT